MDYIWIFFIVAWAAISLTQKNQKKRQQQEEESDEQAREVLQRQLEEIFGRRVHPAAPRPTATPAHMEPMSTDSASAKSTTRHKVPTPPAETIYRTEVSIPPKSAQHRSEIPRPADTSHRNIVNTTSQRQLPNKRSNITEQQSVSAATTNAVKPQDNSELERIIGEFDMERAVIYSEILKPKYEEY